LTEPGDGRVAADSPGLGEDAVPRRLVRSGVFVRGSAPHRPHGPGGGGDQEGPAAGGTAIIGVYHRDSVFFWLCAVLYSRVCKHGFARWGWRGTLAQIEAGAGDGVLPTVQVLTRRGFRRLLRALQVERIEVAGVMPDDFLHLQVVARRMARARVDCVFGSLGGCLVAIARRSEM
jgi:hypothetical protein